MDVQAAVLGLAEPLATKQGLTLIDVEFHSGRRRSILRCVLDKPSGVTLDDCERFHRALGALLDEADPVPGSYVLEVSSPGAERSLKTEREFRLFVGRAVRLAAREDVAGRREWQGVLLGMEEGAVLLQPGVAGAAAVAVPLSEIAWARLDMAGGTRRPEGGSD